MIAEINDESLGQPVMVGNVNSGLTMAKLLEAVALLNANALPTMFGPFSAPEGPDE